MKIKLLISVVLLTLISVQTIAAQKDESTATLEETIRFIEIKLNEYGGYMQGNSEYNSISFTENCNAKLNGLLTGRGNDNADFKVTYAFSLADMEPTSVIANGDFPGIKTFLIKMETTGNKGKVRYESTRSTTRETETNYWDHVDIKIADKEMRDRLIRAFQHAIKLCGGKVDPF